RVNSLRSNDAAEAPAEDEGEGDEGEVDDAEDSDEGDDTAEENAAETIVASGAARREVRVPLSSIRRQAPAAPAPAAAPSMRDIALSSGEGTGFAAGTGLDWNQIGQAIDRKLTGFNANQY